MAEKDIYILGIESSCDETAAAVVKNGCEELSGVIASQIEIHKEYGGVVPEIASRAHVNVIVPVVDEALTKAGLLLEDIDGIAVTYGPGLVGALLVGLSFAKGLAWAAGKPLIGVNHIEGHIAANYIGHPDIKPPYICLVVSGGHSHIIKVLDYDVFEILGRTRDDAAGEAFDKVARTLGLGYPGGPMIQEAAERGNPDSIRFPRVKFSGGSLDFSFSGLKTAVINHIHNGEQKGEDIAVHNVAASFQQAVVDVLVENTVLAAKRSGIQTIAIAGGVSANILLRTEMEEKAQKENMHVIYPKLKLCTDNATMIAGAGYFQLIKNKVAGWDINAIPGLKINS